MEEYHHNNEYSIFVKQNKLSTWYHVRSSLEVPKNLVLPLCLLNTLFLGVDLSVQMIAEAQERSSPSNVSFCVGDALTVGDNQE